MSYIEHLPIYFNDEIKKIYLYYLSKDEIPTLFINAIHIFNKITEYETKINKDIYSFTLDELNNCFSECKWISCGIFKIRCRGIKQYTDWAIDQGYVKKSNQGIYNIKYENADINDVFGDNYYEDLDDLLDTIYTVYTAEKYDDNYINLNLASFGLMWYGFDGSEIVQLTKEHFEYPNTIRYKNKIYKIDRHLFDICMSCFSIKTCTLGFDNKQTGEVNRIRYAPKTDYMIKCFYASEEEASKYDGIIVDINNYLRNRRVGWIRSLEYIEDESLKRKTLSKINIQKSGRYFKMYEFEYMFKRDEITSHDYAELFNYPESFGDYRAKILLDIKSYKHWRKYYKGV